MFRVLQWVLGLGLLVMVGLLFWVMLPREVPSVPALKRKVSGYWNLSTGSRIAYWCIPAKGVRRPTPIVFLQGGPGGFISERTLAMLRPLSELGYEVYAYDPVGSGLSERLPNIREYSAVRHVRDLAAIVQLIGDSQVVFIGQSWGAVLAVLYLADHPNRVAQLILTGPAPLQPVIKPLVKAFPPDSLKLRLPLFSNKEAYERVINFRMKVVQFFAQSFGVKLISDMEADAFQTRMNHELNKATVCDTTKAFKAEAGGGYYAQWMTVHSFKELEDPREKLKGSLVPLLILRGQCDNQPWSCVEEYLTLFPHHQLKIIPNEGHSFTFPVNSLRKLIRGQVILDEREKQGL